MRALFLLCFCSSLTFAQLDSNSVTVNASKTATLLPDQVVFYVNVDSPVNSSLTDIVAAVQSTGITLSNFTGLTTRYPSPTNQAPAIEWQFVLPAALDKMKDTVNALTNLQQNIGKNASGLTLQYGVQGTQVSQQVALAQTCPVAELLSDARTQAQKLAAGAGMTVGAILAMSSSVSTTLVSSGVYTNIVYSTPYLSAVPNCSVTVKFAMK